LIYLLQDVNKSGGDDSSHIYIDCNKNAQLINPYRAEVSLPLLFILPSLLVQLLDTIFNFLEKLAVNKSQRSLRSLFPDRREDRKLAMAQIVEITPNQSQIIGKQAQYSKQSLLFSYLFSTIESLLGHCCFKGSN
jgi:hypothetical protein